SFDGAGCAAVVALYSQSTRNLLEQSKPLPARCHRTEAMLQIPTRGLALASALGRLVHYFEGRRIASGPDYLCIKLFRLNSNGIVRPRKSPPARRWFYRRACWSISPSNSEAVIPSTPRVAFFAFVRRTGTHWALRPPAPRSPPQLPSVRWRRRASG